MTPTPGSMAIAKAVTNVLHQLGRTPTGRQQELIDEAQAAATALSEKIHEIDGGDPNQIANANLARAHVQLEDALVRIAQVVTDPGWIEPPAYEPITDA